MKIDLKNEPLFDVNEMDINKSVTFVYGKNGTGKSTLTHIIQQQALDYEVNVFQGFDELVGENRRLNAVVLGEENEIIEKKINALNEEKEQLLKQRNEILESVSEPEKEGESNYWTNYNDALINYQTKEKEIMDLMKKGAAKIKNRQNPPLSKSNYNVNGFKEDIPNAKFLGEKQKELYLDLLRTTLKIAPAICAPDVDLEKLQTSVNVILQKKVEEKIFVKRFDNDSSKRQFAYEGLRIHHKGEICAFCGSPIDDSIFEELTKYFSADEVAKVQRRYTRKN